jgi:hypothetical protein
MAALFGSDRFLIVILWGNGFNDRLFPLWGVHATTLKGAVFPRSLVNFESAVAAQGAGAVVVGAGFLDNFQLVEVFENTEGLSHQPSPPLERKR